MNQKNIDYFPLYVASGQSFCNRVEEIEQLKNCIEKRRPVLLISPRRYGKTSLVLQTIQKLKYPYGHIDLFSAVDELDIEKAILKSIGKLLSTLETVPKRALALAKEVFSSSYISVTFGKFEISIDADKRKGKAAHHVLDILERLELLAEKTGQNIILFFDEFQCIREITPDHAMESVLRQVAQLTKSIAFIFSGSSRHLLSQLFDDRNRPFYKLCERMTLERISKEAYTKHLQHIFHLTWKMYLDEKLLEQIFWQTEMHPYYINLLCSRLCRNLAPPTEDMIIDIWHQLAKEERSSVAAEIELLSRNQRKLLTILARTSGTHLPQGKEFIHRANMAKTTIEQSMTFLETKDYIYKDSQGLFRVLDPIFKIILSEL